MNIEHLALTHVADAIAVHDIEGRYLWASPSYVDLLGTDPGDLVGRHVYDLIHPDDVNDAQVAHETVTSLTSTSTIVHRLRHADEIYRWVESTLRFVPSEQIIVVGTRPVAQRPTSLDGLAAERHWADQLRELIRQKEGFLTAISHRVRNPLAIVHSLAEMLQVRWRDIDPTRVDDLLERLVANTTELYDLLEDVTQAEQLSRRARAMRTEPINLDRTVRAEVDVIEHDGPIDIQVPPGTVVFADPHMLRMVLRILLGNATRHTPPRTPIRILAERRAAGTLLVVEDDGPGIPAPSRSLVFTAFGRASDDDPDPGLGLGLHTVAEIVAAHRGRVWVEEGRRGGASFHILLPTATQESQRTHVDIDLTDAAALSRQRSLTILAVDDDPAVLQLMAMSLQAEGHRVHTVTNGVDALTEVFRLLPDVIVLDEMMPGINGREVTRTVRSSPRVEHIPIVICSALTGEQDRWEARVAGADAFVPKPFDTEVLAAVVSEVSTRTRR